MSRLMNEVATFWVQAFYRTSRDGVGADRRESHMPVHPSGCAEQRGSTADRTQNAPVLMPKWVKRKKRERKWWWVTPGEDGGEPGTPRRKPLPKRRATAPHLSTTALRTETLA